MLRILFINRMASMERGGGETFDLEMARHLVLMGHRVTFLSGIPLFGRARRRSEVGSRTSDLGPLISDLRPLTSVTLRAPMFPWFPWDRMKGGWRVRVAEFWLFEKLAARWAYKHRDEFDIIQVCELPVFVSSFKSAIGKRLSALPRVVLRLTAPNVYDPSGGIQQADAVIASGTTIDKIRRTVRADCHDIPNAVDAGRFQVAGFRLQVEGKPCSCSAGNEERRTKDEKQAAFTLLYVARFQAFKNHDLLVRAFAHVLREKPCARLVLAGGGPLLGDIKRRVTALGSSLCNNPPRPSDTPPEEGRKNEGSVPSLEGNEGWVACLSKQVVFLGEVPFNDLPEVYAAADIKVISSEYESFCFAALEAMAAGLPIVTTDCGWVPGLIGDTLPPIEKQWVSGSPEPKGRFGVDVDGKRLRAVSGGVVVDRKDAASLAGAVLMLAADKNKRIACGKWNREKAVREHGWKASAQALLRVYDALSAQGQIRNTSEVGT